MLTLKVQLLRRQHSGESNRAVIAVVRRCLARLALMSVRPPACVSKTTFQRIKLRLIANFANICRFVTSEQSVNPEGTMVFVTSVKER